MEYLEPWQLAHDSPGRIPVPFPPVQFILLVQVLRGLFGIGGTGLTHAASASAPASLEAPPSPCAPPQTPWGEPELIQFCKMAISAAVAGAMGEGGMGNVASCMRRTDSSA